MSYFIEEHSKKRLSRWIGVTQPSPNLSIQEQQPCTEEIGTNSRIWTSKNKHKEMANRIRTSGTENWRTHSTHYPIYPCILPPLCLMGSTDTKKAKRLMSEASVMSACTTTHHMNVHVNYHSKNKEVGCWKVNTKRHKWCLVFCHM